jgi:hypothetical protein
MLVMESDFPWRWNSARWIGEVSFRIAPRKGTHLKIAIGEVTAEAPFIVPEGFPRSRTPRLTEGLRSIQGRTWGASAAIRCRSRVVRIRR